MKLYKCCALEGAADATAKRVLDACGARTRAVASAAPSSAFALDALYLYTSETQISPLGVPNRPNRLRNCIIYTLLRPRFHLFTPKSSNWTPEVLYLYTSETQISPFDVQNRAQKCSIRSSLAILLFFVLRTLRIVHSESVRFRYGEEDRALYHIY